MTVSIVIKNTLNKPVQHANLGVFSNELIPTRGSNLITGLLLVV
jgi:hypothetical protein